MCKTYQVLCSIIAVYIDSLVMISIERSDKNKKRALKDQDKLKKIFSPFLHQT